MWRSISALAVTATASFVAMPMAWPTIMVPLSIEDLTARSPTVVRATVKQRQSVWDDAHKRIYTLTELSVSEVIHGDAPTTVVVKTIGGQVEGIGMKVSGMPRLAADEDVVLFLRPAGRDFTVVGMSQGLYRLEKDAQGRMLAVPGVEGVAFVRNSNGTQTIEHHSDAVRLPYAELKKRIVAAASERSSPTPVVP